MTKRRLLRWSLILVTLAAFAVWLEPTRVVWGWLRGEAFYQGRPTSYWRSELSRWRNVPNVIQFCPFSDSVSYARERSLIETWLDRINIRAARVAPVPPMLDGEADALPVLRELAIEAQGNLLTLVQSGIERASDPTWETYEQRMKRRAERFRRLREFEIKLNVLLEKR